jgi:hypothetical protein
MDDDQIKLDMQMLHSHILPGINQAYHATSQRSHKPLIKTMYKLKNKLPGQHRAPTRNRVRNVSRHLASNHTHQYHILLQTDHCMSNKGHQPMLMSVPLWYYALDAMASGSETACGSADTVGRPRLDMQMRVLYDQAIS